MKSDSYMFSPFISTPHIASKTSSSSTKAARPVDSEGKDAPPSPDNHHKKSRGLLENQELQCAIDAPLFEGSQVQLIIEKPSLLEKRLTSKRLQIGILIQN
ncbi:hypothetical protein POTOM_059868 [Populus tomentosa]|uniref:Uncharacterized protein n=1 Tax=Populus tomentosa TaxID=118781 RepID=A0A8X8BW53_POPTO|nr:hypothetical protein POTOM_059868 [Populus tomentosa]